MKKKTFGTAIAILAAGSFLYWQNNHIVLTKKDFYNKKIPLPFDGYRILHLSDLQNKSFGKNHAHLVRIIEETVPDVIFITGDLIDRNRTDIDVVIDLIKQIVHIAPVYYVSGNHEHQSYRYDDLMLRLEDAGVHSLDNECTYLERGKEKINVCGIADIRVNKNYKSILKFLRQRCETDFVMLLSHRPEIFMEYVKNNMDLTFVGHAHGGQIRLPFVGGLYSPHQGLLPKYTNGIYSVSDKAMIVSRGLGNSSRFPFRIFNRPELIKITLRCKNIEKNIQENIIIENYVKRF